MLILIMMLAMEEALCEMLAEEVNEQGLPPGFRFHPTDEELITFYLASKVLNGGICGVEIAEVDLNRCEPWELPDAAKMGEKEWYFFNLRDRKYPTGLRTNRATEAGYWKATGKDREVFSAATGALLGMKKTLVFYRGRAPRGEKTKWVMHEYRLDGNFSCRHACKEEWVICRIFHKAAGEKIKNQFFRAHSYLLEASVTNSTSLHRVLETSPALLESQTPIQSLQNPFFINQESNLKTLINPVGLQSRMFPLSRVEHSFSSTITNATGTDKNTITNYPSPSILYNSLLSHQDYTLIESTAPKQCKTVANFSHFQPFDANSQNWMDKIHQNPCQAEAPLFWEMDCGGENMMGFSAVTDRVHEISSSIAFNQAGFQMMLDPAIRGPGESGPLDV